MTLLGLVAPNYYLNLIDFPSSHQSVRDTPVARTLSPNLSDPFRLEQTDQHHLGQGGGNPSPTILAIFFLSHSTTPLSNT